MRAPFLGLGGCAPHHQPAENARRGRLYHAQDGLCLYCTDPMVLGYGGSCRATTEHKHPVSRGGTDHPTNLAAACEACNGLKGDMTEAEFRAAYPTPEAIRAQHERRRERNRARRLARRTRAQLLASMVGGRCGVTLAERLGFVGATQGPR